jgi:imidazole glycerol-phosphate synthase subunit HisH
MITILDYGMGNISSIANMIKKVGGEVRISNKISDLETTDKIILPGVGAFDSGMEKIYPFQEVLSRRVLYDKVPILGICLGAQLLTRCSQEGIMGGLDFVNAEVVKLYFSDGTKVPHMGWNYVEKLDESSLIFNYKKGTKFYFVHSYHIVCYDIKDIILTTSYGDKKFTAAFQKDNIYGVQFHPEKSHKYGMWLMKNFVEKC